MNYLPIIEYFEKSKCKYMTNERMANHTTFKIGGNADVFLEIPNLNILKNALDLLKKHNIPFLFIGNGSNILINDSGYRGVVLNLKNEFEDISVDGEIINCGAGAQLFKVCKFALENSLTGLEFAYGIPGSVGGAVFMNAGAYEKEIKDVILSVNCIGRDNKVRIFSNQECKFGYRNSIFSSEKFAITSAKFKLSYGKYKDIKEKMDDILLRRKLKQPLEYPSAGSFFKRPIGFHASALIDQCGLKGFRIGDAAISSKHAGFVVNLGNATYSDIDKLRNEIILKVFEKTNVKLDTEVQLI